MFYRSFHTCMRCDIRNQNLKISLTGAQTSTVSFLNALITQWYLNLSGDVHVWLNARVSHSFFWAALSHSSSEDGHLSTAVLLFNVSKQDFCCVVHHYIEKVKQSICTDVSKCVKKFSSGAKIPKQRKKIGAYR